MLSKDEILAGAFSLPFEEVKIGDKTVGMQGMTAVEMISFGKAIKGRKSEEGEVEGMAKLIVRCLVDDKRERILGDDDWPVVTKWPHSVITRLASVANRLNSPDAEGNSEATLDGSSSSD